MVNAYRSFLAAVPILAGHLRLDGRRGAYNDPMSGYGLAVDRKFHPGLGLSGHGEASVGKCCMDSIPTGRLVMIPAGSSSWAGSSWKRPPGSIARRIRRCRGQALRPALRPWAAMALRPALAILFEGLLIAALFAAARACCAGTHDRTVRRRPHGRTAARPTTARPLSSRSGSRPHHHPHHTTTGRPTSRPILNAAASGGLSIRQNRTTPALPMKRTGKRAIQVPGLLDEAFETMRNGSSAPGYSRPRSSSSPTAPGATA